MGVLTFRDVRDAGAGDVLSTQTVPRLHVLRCHLPAIGGDTAERGALHVPRYYCPGAKGTNLIWLDWAAKDPLSGLLQQSLSFWAPYKIRDMWDTGLMWAAPTPE